MTISFHGHRVVITVAVACLLALCLVVVTVLLVRYRGSAIPVPSIPRETQILGSGEPLTYVVLGDSTAVGQGGQYDQGVAVSTAEHLAQNFEVTFVNLAMSGARTKDVLQHQVDEAARYTPDVVLLAVGANDVTHVTQLGALRSHLETIVSRLTQANCKAKLVLTGAPAMGTVPRFPQPLRYLAGVRTAQVNDVFRKVSADEKVTFAPVADETNGLFRSNKSLFAEDLFHPSTEGYATWVPVLEAALNDALATQPHRCK